MGGGLSQTKKQTLYQYQNQNGNIIKAQAKPIIQGPGSNRYGKEYALQFDNEYHDEVNTCVQIATANLKKRAAFKNPIREKVRRNAVRARIWNQHVADTARQEEAEQARQARQAEQAEQARQFRARVTSNPTRRNSKNTFNNQSFPSKSKPMPINQKVIRNGNSRRRATLKPDRNALGNSNSD